MDDRSRPPRHLALDGVLRLRAGLQPDDAAAIFRRDPHDRAIVTWGDLDAAAGRVAGALEAGGLRRGDRAAVVLEDSPAGLAAVFGVWRAGGVLVPVDRRWGPQRTSAILGHAEPRRLLGTDRDCAELPRPAACVALPFEAADRADAPPSGRGSDAADVAIVAYTSGTTSSPKGVVIRHRHLRAAYAIARNHLFEEPPRRFGNVFRMGGLGVLGLNYLFAMECGSATVVLPELGLDTAPTLWADVRDAGVEFLYLVPTLVQLVTRLARPCPGAPPTNCVTGAAPIARELHGRFQDLFGHPLRNIYGITEASFGVFYGALEAAGRGAWHLGPPASPIRARLRNGHGRIVDGAGEGELEVAGPTLTDGYWRNEAATREVFRDGWLRTGDLARRDERGNFTIVGRTKDVVIRGGFNIHLDEIDQVLQQHPLVLGACTVGVAAGAVDEEMAALVQVVGGSGVRPRELADWCRDRLGAARTPGRIVAVEHELPRNSSGKIVRPRVRELLASTL